ncbi:MAG: beta-ketoacyl-[acyl-carrier-protein] synthase family protein [Verrucomicrobiota bacterium]
MAFRADTILKSSHRVCVTGAGIITSMGCGWDMNEAGFRLGKTAFRKVSLFETKTLRSQQAGEVVFPASEPWIDELNSHQRKRLERASRLLLAAGHEAWDQARWSETERALSIPLCLGTSAGAMALGEAYYRQATRSPGKTRGQPTRVQHYQIQQQAVLLARSLRVEGPVTMVSNACASGANAIGHAFHLVKTGRAPLAMAGGYDALCQLVFAGFNSLQALSPGLPRPFDAERDGLALGEGAAVLTLERLDRAEARGAPILGEVRGYGASTDGHHLTQPHPEGEAALRSMSGACEEAGLESCDIDYINSHGTGTPLNDVAEGRAIQRWAGGREASVSVSSTKGAIGHLLGGAGAVETVISLMALKGGWLPPNANVRVPDPVCTFDLVREPRKRDIRHVLTNSFGFGGSNATLVLSALPR